MSLYLGTQEIVPNICLDKNNYGTYYLLKRVKDDSNNEIGTVSGFFKDANNVVYAVVCLDAQYRLNSGIFCSDTTTVVTDLPQYKSIISSYCMTALETATSNTQNILNFCSTNSYTSTSCSHCRSKSFVIGGVTYYGQLPNMKELYDMSLIFNNLNTLDGSSSSYSSLLFSNNKNWWTSTQYDGGSAWYMGYFGRNSYSSKTNDYGVCPVLEIQV